MNTDELAAIRERCDAATPGPWQIGRLLIDGQKHRSVHDAEGWMVANLDLRNRTAEDAEANVFFIAHARTDIPALLDEVERLRTWDGMMSVFDDHYPSVVFDGSSGDDGPRIIVMSRIIDGLRAEVERLRAALEDIAESDPWVPISDIGRRMDIDVAKRALGVQP